MKRKYTKEDIDFLIDTLEKMYPDAHCELNYNTTFELLVAVILSAQCTDKRVNQVTDVLFKDYSTVEQFANIDAKVLEKYIFSCGFYKNKTKSIIACAKEVLTKYTGQVPNTIEELVKLPGVGRKTANVVYAEAFKGNAIAVDTHVKRVSNRLGLAKSDNPEKVEMTLRKLIPQEKWTRLHHLFIFFGRYTCHSQNPDCQNCKLTNYCIENNKRKVNI